MKLLHKSRFIIILVLFVPLVALADWNLAGSKFKGIVQEILDIIKILIPILVGLAVIFFFWGLSKFILNSDKPEKIKEGKSYMLWGILVLFILLSINGIIGFIANELELSVASDTSNLLPTP